MGKKIKTAVGIFKSKFKNSAPQSTGNHSLNINKTWFNHNFIHFGWSNIVSLIFKHKTEREISMEWKAILWIQKITIQEIILFVNEEGNHHVKSNKYLQCDFSFFPHLSDPICALLDSCGYEFWLILMWSFPAIFIQLNLNYNKDHVTLSRDLL